MTQFSWNSKYLTRDGKPWTPTMGEFHYHRYPENDWRREILKMKAGGIDIVTTYVFWYAHEPEEGSFIFSGRYDLRRFVKECADAGVYTIVRLGPWCHGEARLGGMPAWMHKKGFTPRTMDDRYFQCVASLWKQIYEQCRGLEVKDGGPIVGYQLENEFGHCGGEGGDAHIDRLYNMAREIGFDAPYFTATGWGGAFIGSHCVPVMGGYEDAPWDSSTKQLPPNQNYIFSHVRNDAFIGSDFGTGLGLTFDKDKYPFITCELGGGLMPTYNRRPVIVGKDAAAMAMVKLGSGANVLGYYMYHGGTNPRPDMQESREAGDFCELPEYSYDFQAPLGEYGCVNSPFRELKLLAMFTRDFAEELAVTEPVIFDGTAKSASDFDTVNYCVRRNGDAGFVFVNNYQRLFHRAHQSFVPDLAGIPFPKIEMEDGEFAFYPFNMKISGATIKSALATPLCRLNGSTYVFYTDHDPCYDISGDADIITLSREQALNAYKLTIGGKDRLIVSDAPVVETVDGFSVTSDSPVRMRVFPDFEDVPRGLARIVNNEYETVASIPPSPAVTCTLASKNPLMQEFRLEIGDCPEGCETFLTISYQGAMAELFIDGKKSADNFSTGTPWNISLARFGNPREAMLRVYSLHETMPVYVEYAPEFKNGFALKLDIPCCHVFRETRIHL